MESEKEKVKETFSIWTSFLNEKPEDPYMMYKDTVALQLEKIIIQVKNDLMKHDSNYNEENALKGAIAIVMERMLVIQNEYSPEGMNAMVVALFAELPSLKGVRADLVNQARKTNRFAWIKNFFSKKDK